MTETKSVPYAAKLFAAVLLAAALLLHASVPGVNAAGSQADSAEQYAVFLEEKYDIAIQSEVTKGEFIQYVAEILDLQAPEAEVAFADLAADDALYASAAALYAQGILSGPTVAADEALQPWVASLIALRASHLQELAYTYPQSKVDAALQKLGVSADTFNDAAARELAAAVDTGLIPEECYAEFSADQPASQELVQTLLGKVLSLNGAYKQYIGFASDADIYSKFITAFQTSDIIEIPNLQPFVDDALKQDVVTGYNLKDDRYDANFVPSLTIAYGHSNVQHAIQLLGLLRSEGIDARVQLEPKTSAYVHRKEWGEPYVDENSKAVLTENGNYIHSSKEYDLVLEFFNTADKEAFQSVILQYAKKNEDDQPGLIAGSWWQPLFYTLVEPNAEGYKLIANNKIVDGHYYAQTFSLTEDAESIAAGFSKLDPEVEVESYTFWANEAFFNYLNGEGL
ncbi:hypothetical protein DUZ99_17880 [Xylanibacillus composti]|uniref:SLH domain-containing protein n=1 Tax=Xylanibacillus composti TaxID=1572762 RepID=A0A8J4H6L5_9BACL|nr:hypothetical protein [Xylanibacillus composti]MDT9726851.1 hypothetical protein [Xylanibacillus composti]GIQ70647.1 hypothetical protein XYCOK13_34710 [Xylanibacillus composti]